MQTVGHITIFAEPWLLNKSRNKSSTTHQANERTLCRPFTISKGTNITLDNFQTGGGSAEISMRFLESATGFLICSMSSSL